MKHIYNNSIYIYIKITLFLILFSLCKTEYNSVSVKKIPTLEGKWGIISYGTQNDIGGYVHGSYRIIFYTNGQGSYFHKMDTLNICDFTYVSVGDTLKLNYTVCNLPDGILEGYKIFYLSKIETRKFGSSKFYTFNLRTANNNIFELGRPKSHQKY